MYQGKLPIRVWRRTKRLLQANSLALEEEEMKIRPPPAMRFYWSNKTTEQHQQPSIEEPSTQEDYSLIDLAAISNLLIPPIPIPKEEEIHIQLRWVFSGIKGNRERFVLFDKGKVAPSIDIPKKVDQSLEEFKEVIYDELPKWLPPKRDI